MRSPAYVRLGRYDLVLGLPQSIALVGHVSNGPRKVQVIVHTPHSRNMPSCCLLISNTERSSQEREADGGRSNLSWPNDVPASKFHLMIEWSV